MCQIQACVGWQLGLRQFIFFIPRFYTDSGVTAFSHLNRRLITAPRLLDAADRQTVAMLNLKLVIWNMQLPPLVNNLSLNASYPLFSCFHLRPEAGRCRPAPIGHMKAATCRRKTNQTTPPITALQSFRPLKTGDYYLWSINCVIIKNNEELFVVIDVFIVWGMGRDLQFKTVTPLHGWLPS